MPDLVAEMNAAANRVRQVHIDHMIGLGVTGPIISALWGPVASFGVATIEPQRDGTYLPGDGPMHVIQPVLMGGELVDLIAWRSLKPSRWMARTGSAWCLGEEALSHDSWDIATPRAPAIHATPLDWMRAAGDGICILDWGAPEIRGLVAIDGFRCGDQRLAQTLIDTISRPVRLPRILPMEARNAA